MQQDGYTDYLDFYQRGPFAPSLREHRLAGSAPISLLSVVHARSVITVPPVPELLLTLAVRGGHALHTDLGCGAWHGRWVTGAILLAPAGADTIYRPDGPAENLSIGVPVSAIRCLLDETSHCDDFGLLHAAPFRDPFVEVICRRMWEEAEVGHPLGSLFCDSAIVALGAALLRKAEIGPGPLPVRRGGLAPYRLRRVEALLRDRLAEDVSLDELATAAGLSSSHFNRAFRAETGQTPWRYLLACRVDRAKELLVGTDIALSELANACGFADQSHLGTWFKRLTGSTPKQYRQDRRN